VLLKGSLKHKTAATTDKRRQRGWLCKRTYSVVTEQQNFEDVTAEGEG
jgi:hypothetical protein